MKEQLNFFQRFEKSNKELTKKQYMVAEYILKNYKTAVFLSSIELGKKANTSEATVIRLANALGYSGYLEMVKDIQDYIRREITTLEKVEKIENIYKDKTVLDEIIDTNLLMVKSIRKYISNDDILKIVTDISEYEKIMVVGFESSSGVAEYIGYNLSRIVSNVEVINHSSRDLFNIASKFDNKTFGIIISFPRYSKNTVNLAKLLKRQGARTFAITDSILSPVKEYSDYSIIVPLHDSNKFYPDVTIGVMTIFQAVLLQYITDNYKAAQNRLKGLEEFNEVYESFKK
ncbi:MurR/RpiR family transcriptional regulator [Wukongibacter baidiensis]|uniref:MurR/RpiR family transcriptional regulator n=1 Tax=Wukongibacter baidiensis TaxID=1723361 RepID=UPI003D7FD84E